MELVMEGVSSSNRTTEITIYQSSLKQSSDKDMTHHDTGTQRHEQHPYPKAKNTVIPIFIPTNVTKDNNG